MDFLEILAESVAGTTAMTVFSYSVSAVVRKLSAEPVLINLVLQKMDMTPSQKRNGILGWTAHYVMGFFFAVAFHWLWKLGIVPMGWLATLALGVVAGLIGISCWRIFFMLPTEKPNISYRRYYQHLLVAHIIFTATVYAAHIWLYEISFSMI